MAGCAIYAAFGRVFAKIERITIGVHNLGDGQPHIHTPGHWYVHFYSYHAEVTVAGQRFPIRRAMRVLFPLVW